MKATGQCRRALDMLEVARLQATESKVAGSRLLVARLQCASGKRAAHSGARSIRLSYSGSKVFNSGKARRSIGPKSPIGFRAIAGECSQCTSSRYHQARMTFHSGVGWAKFRDLGSPGNDLFLITWRPHPEPGGDIWVVIVRITWAVRGPGGKFCLVHNAHTRPG